MICSRPLSWWMRLIWAVETYNMMKEWMVSTAFHKHKRVKGLYLLAECL
ncbi:hypothetical protein O6H91_13G041200 [Diphasiastrum complanatum]|uniref:Uncharacterized protein n=1 Tax=Diphasiastrum complanatum TaxID=34168 RepID=A0ACC2BU34_DIPCM|nr:hypothetical protein O6H91_13G041200 [Diphasiastrum complanatum]